MQWFVYAKSKLVPPNSSEVNVPIVYVKIIIWTNAANTFNTKESSVHMCVVTVGAQDGDHSGKRSYPIWLGPAKKDLSPVFKKLVTELNHL